MNQSIPMVKSIQYTTQFPNGLDDPNKKPNAE